MMFTNDVCLFEHGPDEDFNLGGLGENLDPKMPRQRVTFPFSIRTIRFINEQRQRAGQLPLTREQASNFGNYFWDFIYPPGYWELSTVPTPPKKKLSFTKFMGEAFVKVVLPVVGGAALIAVAAPAAAAASATSAGASAGAAAAGTGASWTTAATTAVKAAAKIVVKSIVKQAITSTIKGIVFKEGKVVEMPQEVASELAREGISPETVTPEQVIAAAEKVNIITPQEELMVLQTVAPQVAPQIMRQIREQYVARPKPTFAQPYAAVYKPVSAIPNWLLPVGVGVVGLIVVMGGRK